MEQEKKFSELDEIDNEMKRIEARERLLKSSKSPERASAKEKESKFADALGHAPTHAQPNIDICEKEMCCILLLSLVTATRPPKHTHLHMTTTCQVEASTHNVTSP